MLAVETVVLILLVGAAVYGTVVLVSRTRGPGMAGRGPVEWRVNHRDAHGETRVVLQKVTPGGISVLAEHVVATIRIDDPAYDEKFLTAMTAARERRALFESEEE